MTYPITTTFYKYAVNFGIIVMQIAAMAIKLSIIIAVIDCFDYAYLDLGPPFSFEIPFGLVFCFTPAAFPFGLVLLRAESYLLPSLSLAPGFLS